MEEKNKWEQKGHESELVVALIKLLLELQVWLELLDLFTAAIRMKKKRKKKISNIFLNI